MLVFRLVKENSGSGCIASQVVLLVVANVIVAAAAAVD
jgi:hypothetical protein